MNQLARRPMLNRYALGMLAGIGLMAMAHAQIARRPPEPQWLTIPEASRYARVSVALLNRLIAGRRVSALKDGPVWKVKRQDLDGIAGIAGIAESARELRKVMKARGR